VTIGQPVVLLGERFELGALLKRGNGVETHTGIDHLNGMLVIVKMVHTNHVASAVRIRLEHEARVLERLNTAQFRRVVASGRQGDYFYLVQPHLSGETLARRLSRGVLSVDDTLSVASDVLESLRQVHQAGVLHRDIKPTNIMVRGDVSIEGADLIDFGLARSSELDESLRDGSVGTARYLAPESAGLIKAEIDQRADLYSFGVVLFECLAGHPPFRGDSVGEVLRQHLNAEVPKLRADGVAVPSAIDGLIQRMLAKDPQTRYQSAPSVMADISNIQSQLFRGISEPVLTLGLNDRRQVLTEPTFVGRVNELAKLAELLTETQSGRGGLVLVEAESGAGKTRLLDELALQAVQAGLWVLPGRGVDQAALRPFQVFDGVVGEIVAAESDEASTRGVRERIGDWAPATVAALPALGKIFGQVDHAHLGPEAFGEARTIDALSALLDTLGQVDRPALVLLDDCQWVDDLTIQLLRRWQNDRGPSNRRHVLVVVAFRSEEVSPQSALRMLEPLSTLVLQPFGADDIEALCASMAGALPPPALSTIARLADGSPFMASAILRGMVESGALRQTDQGWTIDAGPMEHVQTSRRAAAFLSQRFDLLGTGAIELLSAGAILGKEFDLHLAAVLAGYSDEEATETLSEARHRSILWIDEGEGTCLFAHDKLRESLLDRIGSERRRQLHEQAAETIELTDQARVFEIAYHFDAAGDPVRALPYALVAAEQARQQHALEASVRHYRIAERATQHLGARADEAQLAMIAEGLGDVLTLQGDYAEAIEQLERAHLLTADPMDRAGIEAKLGNIAFKRGDQVMAGQYLEGALRDLGRWVPRHAASVVLATLAEILVQFLHTLLPRFFVGRRSTEGSEREFAAIRMYSRLTYVYWFSAGKFPCAWAHLRELNLAERYPSSPELAQAYSTHAPVMTMIPWFRRGLAYARRSIAIRRDLGDEWGEGQSLNFYGVVLYASSRYRECLEACSESMRLLKHTGDRWEQNTAAWHQIFSHYRLGELVTAVDLARDLYVSASAIGDTTAAGISLSGWSRAGVGNIPERLIATELARDLGDAQTTAEVLLADGVRLLYSGQVETAVARFEQAREVVKESGLRQEYVAPVKPWLATALRMQVETIDVHGPHARARQLHRAARMARSADVISRSYRNNRPHALRERALVANLQGHSARARRLLARSLALANQQGALYEACLTKVAMARLAMVDRGAEASIELADAEAKRLEFEAHTSVEEQPTLSLADRFDTLLEVGRLIGAAASSPEVFAAVHDAAVQLLRGDRCHVLMLGEDLMVDFTTDSGEPVSDLSMSVLARAVATEAPVVSGVGADADSGESLILADLRSVLCAPILSNGRVVACFLFDSSPGRRSLRGR
jgi:tetratricopeptide (TPR) repeat protein